MIVPSRDDNLVTISLARPYATVVPVHLGVNGMPACVLWHYDSGPPSTDIIVGRFNLLFAKRQRTSGS